MTDYLRKKAKQILSKVLEVEMDMIPDDANPDIIKNWDSLNQVKLSIELEKELDRKLTPQEILSLTNLENITVILDKINFDNKI